MAKTKSEPMTKEPDGAPMPTRIVLTCPFGFYDDDNQPHFWQAGQEITDADEIKLLIDAGAEHQDITETE